MAYTVLARKYRPQTFADLVGQEHVSRTIGNAITSGRVAHAFLFTGARGVGKTTTARLLAKSLNCESGPTAEPCNACDACKEITSGIDLDVLEIDGASNNSVDDVRRLQETLPFRPARDRFKVVIVDEVHMLSTGAFNAFLKTLEEPPSHVKFIFATTEVHKVPVTIRSRCQRYDFRLIPDAVVASRVRAILEREAIGADDAAVSLVAREAAGSMRDALTVLDQLLALGSVADTGLRGEDVARGLGIASRKYVWSVMQGLVTADAASCLRTVNEVASQGLDMLHFAKQVLLCTRDLVVLRVLGDEDELTDLVAEEREEAKRLAGLASREELERVFSGVGKLVEEVGQSSSPQITLEMGLVRLADRPPLLPLKELLERLRALEERLSSGGMGPSPGGGPAGHGPAGHGPAGHGPAGHGGGGPRAPSRSFGGPRPPGAGSPQRADSAPSSASWPASETATATALRSSASASASFSGASASATLTASPKHTSLAAAPVLAGTQTQASAKIAALAAAGARASEAHAAQQSEAPIFAAPEARVALASVPPAPATVPSGTPATRSQDAAASTSAVATKPGVVKASAAPAPLPSPVPAPREAAGAATPAGTRDGGAPASLPPAWLQIVSQLKKQQPALGAVLEHGMPLEISTEKLRLGFPDGSFFGKQAQSAACREAILKTAEAVLGRRPELVFGRASGERTSTVAELNQRARSTHEAERKRVALSHPSVRDAIEIFEEAESTIDVQVTPAVEALE